MKKKMCDGWHPFLFRARADWMLYNKSGDHIADLCGGHKPDAEKFGCFTFKAIRASRRPSRKEKKP